MPDNKYVVSDTNLSAIADAIREKGGTSASLSFPDGFVDAIEDIPTGGGGTYQEKTGITPTTSSQTITADAGYDALSSVQINAMPSGTAGTPTAAKGAVSNHSVNVTPSVTNTTGHITGGTKTGTPVNVAASELVSGTKSITANGTGIDVTNYAAVDVAVPAESPSLQSKSKTYTPTENQQTESVAADSGYDGLSDVNVTVNAVPSSYVGSGITRRSSSDLSASGAAVTAPAGYYESAASKSVASGTAGTPTATKGSVSNHAVEVTPSVTNTAGYIPGETKTGTPVTVSASELVSGSETKTANGTYDVTNLAELIVNVSGGGGTAPDPSLPVKFVDYDGTLLYSYSAADLQGLSALPANPSHTGLTAQGWNYTLEQAKNQVAATGNAIIGQMYVTSDNKTRIYIRLDEGRLSPYLGICPNGTVTVDWGDGSSEDTLTGTSETTVKNIQHTYASAGDYVIALTAATGTTFAFYGTSTDYAYILRKSSSSSDSQNPSTVYRNAVKKLELGSAAKIGAYAFQNCTGLTSITIPSGSADSLGGRAFQNCYSLTSIIIPTSITSIGGYGFEYCYSLTTVSISPMVTTYESYGFQYCISLAAISIPYTATIIRAYFFSYCYSLASITVPPEVTTFGGSAFNNCMGIGEYHMKPTSPPTVSNANTFTNIPSDCIIYVPYSADHSVLNAYKTASNWTSMATKMQEES